MNTDEDIRGYETREQLCDLPKIADFAIVGTQDRMHHAPALKLIEKVYNLLLEKPMAPTAKECKEIAEAAEKHGVKVIFCHVLRFTKFWYALKEITDSGKIGTPMSMILAKSCHDMDILQWLIGKPCKKIHSFGGRDYFNAENRTVGAPERCLDNWPHKDTCRHEPIRFYTEYDGKNENPWRDVVADHVGATDEEIIETQKTEPYGRCVFACDNDVVDHQTVNMEFEGGCTVVFTMTAFARGRAIKMFGTNGEIDANMTTNTIKIYDFITGKTEDINLDKVGEDISASHGGGDTGIMLDLMKHFNNETPSKSVCDVHTSYMNHLISFAAEKSRLTDTVIDLNQFSEEI